MEVVLVVYYLINNKKDQAVIYVKDGQIKFNDQDNSITYFDPDSDSWEYIKDIYKIEFNN